LDAGKTDDGGSRLGADRSVPGASRQVPSSDSGSDLDLEFARILTQERPHATVDIKEVQEQLSRTQYVLAEQQLQLSRANVELQARLREQQTIAAQQANTAEELAAIRKELKRERKQQERMALLLLQGVEARADHGKHAG
jgi:hypothetical protein